MKIWKMALLILTVIMSRSPADAKVEADLLNEFDFANVTKVAQSPPSAQTAPSEGEKVNSDYSALKMMEAQHRLYECIVLSIAMVASLWIVVQVIVKKTEFPAEHIVNVSGLFTIVFGVILLVLLADASEQLTASMGILGAIAGYLFGTMKRREPSPSLAVERAGAGGNGGSPGHGQGG